MSSFNDALTPLIRDEGSRVNPHDNGRGPSKYGVTLATYRDFKPDASEKDICNLTLMQATAFYRWWWEKYHLGLIDSQDVANKLFNLGVNCGQETVNRWAQRAVGAHADGVIGPVTAQAINCRTPKLVLEGLRTAGAQHYQELVQRRPEYACFLDGWIERLNR